MTGLLHKYRVIVQIDWMLIKHFEIDSIAGLLIKHVDIVKNAELRHFDIIQKALLLLKYF